MERASILYYIDWMRMLLEVPPELRLKIDDAIKHYVLEGTEPTEPEVRFSMFALIKAQIDRDSERYQARCDKNRDNAYKRWDDVRTNTNACERIRTHANFADKVKDKDKDILNKESIIEKATTSVATPTPKRKVFVVPTVAEIDDYARQYAAQKGLQLSSDFAERFMSYYESNGWLVGKNRMKDWRATVRRWALDNTKNSYNNGTNNFGSNRPSKQELNDKAVREVEMQLADILT